ncbi:hypothetical protein [Flaviaesturariibacter amylovorans]|uniref:Flagellar protein FliT n=1 Tax=Flaviaesturariibacter amylovorans TaxID=1084520 RepID=A0ABP8HQI0_9BACT
MDEFYSVELDTLKHLYQTELHQLSNALLQGAAWEEVSVLRSMVTRLERAIADRTEPPRVLHSAPLFSSLARH